MIRTAYLAAALAVAGCASSQGSRPMEFAPELNVDLTAMTRTSSGLHYQDVQVGSGEEARAGRTVGIHYTGWLADGRQFDSSHDRGQPLEVAIGTGRVIRGWDEGIPGMKVGGRRRLVIPASLAYGTRGAGGVIPPGATLVFDVELVSVR